MHNKDSDCIGHIDEVTHTCSICGVDHGGEACGVCGGVGFHMQDCVTMWKENPTRWRSTQIKAIAKRIKDKQTS